jgi:hypothetical protein
MELKLYETHQLLSYADTEYLLESNIDRTMKDFETLTRAGKMC